MQSMSLFARPALAALAGALAVTSPLSAQEVWRGSQTRGVAIELGRPSFKQDDVTGFATGYAVLSGLTPLTSTLRLAVELPVANLSLDGASGFGGSDFAFANPYLGLDIGKPASRWAFQAGLRLPVASDEALISGALAMGILGDIDRSEAFMPDLLGVTVNAHYTVRSASGLVASARGGTTTIIGVDGGGAELLTNYGVRGGYDGSRFGAGVSLTGRANVTTDDQGVDRALHQVAADMSYGFGRIRPSVWMRIPLDQSVRSDLRLVTGAGLRVAL